jgi:hypothetical protein
MNVLVAGASGFIGSALVPFLTAQGFRVMKLARATSRPEVGEPTWNPDQGEINLALAERIDAVVHLAGESIAGRWTAARKARIHASRVNGTRLLSAALARLPTPPQVLISASATGYYGDRSDEILSEQSAPGEGFLAEVCRAWEEATAPAAEVGVRVVHLRLGLVLSSQGGALGKMLPAFRLGLGGKIGSGQQFWSWIAIEDVLAAVQHALVGPPLSGAMNAVAPSPMTNAEFARTLARVLRRPAVFPMPALAARLLLGEMAEATLLASARVEPRRLLETGFAFRFPGLEPALRHALSKH